MWTEPAFVPQACEGEKKKRIDETRGLGLTEGEALVWVVGGTCVVERGGRCGVLFDIVGKLTMNLG